MRPRCCLRPSALGQCSSSPAVCINDDGSSASLRRARRTGSASPATNRSCSFSLAAAAHPTGQGGRAPRPSRAQGPTWPTCTPCAGATRTLIDGQKTWVSFLDRCERLITFVSEVGALRPAMDAALASDQPFLMDAKWALDRGHPGTQEITHEMSDGGPLPARSALFGSRVARRRRRHWGLWLHRGRRASRLRRRSRSGLRLALPEALALGLAAEPTVVALGLAAAFARVRRDLGVAATLLLPRDRPGVDGRLGGVTLGARVAVAAGSRAASLTPAPSLANTPLPLSE
jgi:hypothetical protein